MGTSFLLRCSIFINQWFLSNCCFIFRREVDVLCTMLGGHMDKYEPSLEIESQPVYLERSYLYWWSTFSTVQVHKMIWALDSGVTLLTYLISPFPAISSVDCTAQFINHELSYCALVFELSWRNRL